MEPARPFLTVRHGPVPPRPRVQPAVATLVALVCAVIAAPGAAAVDCGPATGFVADKRPQRAVAYVDAINAPFADDASKQCTDERAKALEIVHAAEALAVEAERLVGDGQKDAAREKADASKAMDRENERALGVLTALDAKTPFWERVAKGWESLQKNVLTPMATLALPVAGLIAGLLLLARLLVLARQDWPGRTQAASARRALGAGWVLVALGSVGLVALAVGAWPAATGPLLGVLVAIGLVTAALGVGLTAWGTARKLRVAVRINKAGEEDPAASAHVLSLLEELGASPPRGIERPVGPDVEALENVLTEVKVGWVATVATAVSSLLGWTPWRVVVDLDGEVTSAQILRNGRSRGSLILTGKDLEVPGSDAKLDPHVFLAAFVVTTLSEAHQGFGGLCGATSWRGVGLQYAAAGPNAKNGLALLKQAVKADPGNWLARADLQHQLHRKSSDAGELAQYAAWLDGAIERVTRTSPDEDARLGRVPLVLRLHLFRALVGVNRVFALQEGADDGNEVEVDVDAAIADAKAAIIALCGAAHAAGRTLSPRSVLWLQAVRSRAAAMAVHVSDDRLTEDLGADVAADVRSWAELDRSPSAHYSWACSHATPGLRVPVKEEQKTAVEAVLPELRAAWVSDRVVAWLPKDPQLKWFRETPQFSEFRPALRTELFDLAPLSTHRAALERCGLDSPGLLASVDPTELALRLGLAPPASVHLVEVAAVYCSLNRRDALTTVAVEAVAHLLEAGLASLSALAALDPDGRRARAAKLAEETLRFTKKKTQVELAAAYAEWLEALTA
ncbi:hypothetical protein [Propioniciclava sinopodophylli]|uniref:hypothetical protein n=1 Tax=Propioniciclava sinopodophylli TaxID=1837344 RepID=UPI00248F9A59|nr:hypothetical protein [Propioniciclava sinopodophylli]